MTLLASGIGAAPVVEVLAQRASEPKCYQRFVNEWVCLDYLRDRGDEIADATLEHIGITVAAVLLGLLIAFPMALLARRLPQLESGVLGVSTGIYTIPSLALFPLLLPFTGLSPATVIVGLGLYCLTILVRAMLDGLRAVPDEVRESAVGLGYGAGRMLFRIELPLAVPVIMGGLRIATVSTVALTTVGTLVSYGGLGDMISHGQRTDFRAELLTAAVLCVALAVLLDVVLVVVERLLTPWTRGVST